MKQYQDLIESVLVNGQHKPNRTGVDTISTFAESYRIDLSRGYPLLTTKQMDGHRWDSMLHEFLWYISGEHHIRNLSEETGIWDAWADDEGVLDTAYGRFWRRFPMPIQTLEGEAWAGFDNKDVDGVGQTFDQLQHAIDTLQENPRSRRIVVSSWHPGNAAVSTLPPCHFAFVFNVQGDRLNLHLSQRSADVALGVPFNIAAYALLLEAVAQHTGFEAGEFYHTLVDAHIYCGAGERGKWYRDHLDELLSRLPEPPGGGGSAVVIEWLEDELPEEEVEGQDHVPNLLRQLYRTPYSRPEIDIADKPLDDLEVDDITLRSYTSHGGLSFGVAE